MCAESAARPETRGNAPLQEDAWWQRRLLWLPHLDHDERDQKHKAQHQQRDDPTLAPLDAVNTLAKEGHYE
jgi:hypothetical protein